MPKGEGSFRFPGRIVLPAVLIILGGLLLLSNFAILEGDWWSHVKKLWPLILVLIGIDLLIKK